MKIKLTNDLEIQDPIYLDLVICTLLDQYDCSNEIEFELSNGQTKQLDDEINNNLINWAKLTIDKIDEYEDKISSYEIVNQTLRQIIDHAKSGKHLTREESDSSLEAIKELGKFHFEFNDLISDIFLQLADRLENLRQENEKLLSELESMQVKR